MRLITAVAAAAILSVGCVSEEDAAEPVVAESSTITEEPTTTAAPTTTEAPTTTTTAAPPTTSPSTTAAPAPPAPAPQAVMPSVVCMNLQEAQDLIQENGVFYSRSYDATGEGRNQVIDSNWVVVAQSPAPGTPIGEGDAELGAVKYGEPSLC